ncbi:MAG: hypothetical protein R3F59_14655 [Myxococcota bacterium]
MGSSTLSNALLLLGAVAALPVIGGSLASMYRAQDVTLAPMGRGEAAPSAPDRTLPPPPPPPAVPLREVDHAVLRLSERRLRGTHEDDVYPDAAFRVDLDGAGGTATGARIDLDRDGHVDEVWTFQPLERRVGEGADAMRFVWGPSGWEAPPG